MVLGIFSRNFVTQVFASILICFSKKNLSICSSKLYIDFYEFFSQQFHSKTFLDFCVFIRLKKISVYLFFVLNILIFFLQVFHIFFYKILDEIKLATGIFFFANFNFYYLFVIYNYSTAALVQLLKSWDEAYMHRYAHIVFFFRNRCTHTTHASHKYIWKMNRWKMREKLGWNWRTTTDFKLLSLLLANQWWMVQLQTAVCIHCNHIQA